MTASSLNSHLARLGGVELEGETSAIKRRTVTAAQAGCPEAFRTFVETYQVAIYHFCYRYLRDVGDAQEACQDTFVRAHGALARLDARDHLIPWLYRIALNRCHDQARARKAARRSGTIPLGELGELLPCNLPQPDTAAGRNADLSKLDRGLQALPKRSRAVVVLTCLDGFTHAQCAEILKCSERAVEGRLYRARKQLATWWERDTQ